MKQLAVFFLFLSLCIGIRIHPQDLDGIRSSSIHVTVDGEVEDPGVIELPAYATVEDALEKAGVKESADLSAINPQTILTDRDILHVPEAGDDTVLSVSINTASAEELCLLPGIGRITAERIVEYRETEGLFQNMEDLMRVKGIGQKKYESLKGYIRL